MPEEIAIALIILFVIGWIIVALIGAVASATHAAHQDVVNAISRRTERNFSKKKSRLANHVRVLLPNELQRAEAKLHDVEAELNNLRAQTVWEPKRPAWNRRNFVPYSSPIKRETWHEMDVQDIERILHPDTTTWLQKQSEIITKKCEYPFQAPENNCLDFNSFSEVALSLENAVFEVDQSVIREKHVSRFFQKERNAVVEYNERRSAVLSRLDHLNKQIRAWNLENRNRWSRYAEESARLAKTELAAFAMHSEQYVRQCMEQKARIENMVKRFRAGARQGVADQIEHILGELTLPISIPHSWEIDFDEDQRILIVEIALPDVVHRPPMKTVVLKSGPVKKPLNQTERKELIPKIHPAIILRVAYEILRNDDRNVIALLVLNGWVSFDEPNTGISTRAYTASLVVEPTQIASLNLTKVDPVAAFQALNGKSAGKLIEIIPIEPTLNLNKRDSRFVDAKAILNMLGSSTNLAAMDWQDFEHLIRELFEREFAERGAEVKITQASRDRGVDAIAFDPDPIHGGKYVIQAKRYTNTVDVSAVRDLCAVVRKEGASRGILVTTSTYGADAYAFANNEPVTLLNGAELLGLLKKHGYSFRINLQEARKLHFGNLRQEKSTQIN